jgi:hypothetical protein
MSWIMLMLLALLYCTSKGGMAPIDHALIRDRWWAFVNMVMNPQVPLKKQGIWLASPLGFCSKELVTSWLHRVGSIAQKSRDRTTGIICFGCLHQDKIEKYQHIVILQGKFQVRFHRGNIFFIITDALVLSKFLKITDTKLQHINCM